MSCIVRLATDRPHDKVHVSACVVWSMSLAAQSAAVHPHWTIVSKHLAFLSLPLSNDSSPAHPRSLLWQCLVVSGKAPLAGALSLHVRPDFGASQKTELYRTETAVFPQNKTETYRRRPAWNRLTTLVHYNVSWQTGDSWKLYENRE